MVYTSYRLDSAALRQVRVDVFEHRLTSLNAAAAAYDQDGLAGRVVALWAEMKRRVADLPATAFERQSIDVHGFELWSAGQVVSHLAEIGTDERSFWEVFLSDPLPDPSRAVIDAAGHRPLRREASLNALDGLTAMFAEIRERLRFEPDTRRFSNHPVFGLLNLKGALLITCIHLSDQADLLDGLATGHGRQAA
jgi:hypothetical protein